MTNEASLCLPFPCKVNNLEEKGMLSVQRMVGGGHINFNVRRRPCVVRTTRFFFGFFLSHRTVSIFLYKLLVDIWRLSSLKTLPIVQKRLRYRLILPTTLSTVKLSNSLYLGLSPLPPTFHHWEQYKNRQKARKGRIISWVKNISLRHCGYNTHGWECQLGQFQSSHV